MLPSVDLTRRLAFVTLAALTIVGSAAAAEPIALSAEETTHKHVLIDRAAKIVEALKLSDADLETRVRDEIVGQYQALGKLHDAGVASPTDLDALHRRFLARLAAQLSPEQVNQIKDGMTYGVVTVTLNGYRELLPELTDEQLCEIHAQLLEAREYAMDAGSSDAKHAVFGKYKGRINKYLSQAGYDLKQAEKQRASRRQAANK